MLVLLLVAYGAWWLAAQLTGDTIPGNPFVAFGFRRYRALWTPLATVFTVIAESALVGVAVWALVRRFRRSEIDKRATTIADYRELSEVTGRSALEKAKRLRPGVDMTEPGAIGLTLGTTIPGDAPITQSYEDTTVVVAGPRTGKTAGAAIPSVLDAPGPVIATSNKSDLRDHTRGARELIPGSSVWESDLQGVTGEAHQNFWWNPLGNITSLKDARRLASRFIAAEKIDGARVDGYFDGGAAELLAIYFLAAAIAEGDLMHAYAWLSDEANDFARKLLADSGHTIAATKLRTAQGLYPKQRDGLYDVARRNLNVLTDPDYARTVLPQRRRRIPGDDTDLAEWSPTHSLPEFDPQAFVVSRDTLYAMSMEGADAATALVTTLVGRIFDEALKVARVSPGRRLAVPLLPALDEAANVCPLPELPKWYSHFGSQGIVCQTYVQSPAQAIQVWGEEGWQQMLAAANVHYYGGGVKDTDYLGQISETIGLIDVSRWSTSHNPHGVAHSQSWSSEAAMPVSMLAKLPKDRAIVMTTGNPPVLVRKTFWSDRHDAGSVTASLAKYGPDSHIALAKEIL
ncbi:type IV secretory system conjugative DNA transfer family protein [Nocardia veterana]|uniref:TraM recognition domain-containing protein n=1 Tax=Nocardia veterana TaxID=132249 RepID=A0A7X6M252_9NOCA|nr:type IV secretory system conjugative DNA transfer family protein [Nocardia veterana]NKY88899.1 TraM recognition domain-containing protein [Nocardia veterana]